MQLPKRKPGKYLPKNDPHITQEKFDALERKLKRLKKEQPEAAAEVSRLAALGDFSENVEYQLAKRRLRSINNRILKLDFQINHAQIIEKSDTSMVQIGHTVTVLMDGKERKYTILGSSETDPSKGIISHTSPIGSALLGKAVDDEFVVEIAGKERKIKVTNIS